MGDVSPSSAENILCSTRQTPLVQFRWQPWGHAERRAERVWVFPGALMSCETHTGTHTHTERERERERERDASTHVQKSRERERERESRWEVIQNVYHTV